jgi:hypothetical protein
MYYRLDRKSAQGIFGWGNGNNDKSKADEQEKHDPEF